MKHIRIIILILFAMFLSSCGTVKEAFTNQKKKSSDEFLVEKKLPLVMPPNFEELPIPNEENLNAEDDENKIKNLISKEKDNKIENNTSEKNKSLEDNLLKKIKSN